MGIRRVAADVATGIGSGLGWFLKKNEKFGLFEPKARHDAVKANSNSLGSEKTKLTTSTSVFDDYMNNRISSIYDLAKLTTEDEKDSKIRHQSIKTPDGSSLADKLKPAASGFSQDQRDTIKCFDDALDANGLTKFKRDFEDDINDLNNAIKKEPEKFDMAAIASYLQTLRATAETGIKEQQTREKDEISNLFTSGSQSLNDIEKSMGLKPGPEVETFKKTILAELEKSHKAQLDAFNKATGDEIKALYKAANEDRDRINALSIMYQNRFNRRRIDELIKNRPDKGNAFATSTISSQFPTSARFKGIDVNDMAIMKTITGREMIHNKENNSFSMELPRFDPLYYRRRSDQIDYDFTSMAQAIKACGFHSIKFEVNYKDEAYAMELARKQFEAACRAGFDPNETKDPKDPNKTTCRIKCVVNGKEISIGELFKLHPKRLQTAHANAAKDKESRMEEYSKNSNREVTNTLREAVKVEKNQRLGISAP